MSSSGGILGMHCSSEITGITVEMSLPSTPSSQNTVKTDWAKNPRNKGQIGQNETASLLLSVGKQVMVSLRDGRIFFGELGTIDQFANLLMTKSVERIFVNKKYGEVPRGIVMIRGDNVVLIGETDEEYEMTKLEKVSPNEILAAQKEVLEKLDIRERKRAEGFKAQGLHYIPKQSYQDFISIRLDEDFS